MDVTVSTLKVVDKLIELRESQHDGPDSQDHESVGKDRFLGLTLPSGATQTQPMMVGQPSEFVKCFL